MPAFRSRFAALALAVNVAAAGCSAGATEPAQTPTTAAPVPAVNTEATARSFIPADADPGPALPAAGIHSVITENLEAPRWFLQTPTIDGLEAFNTLVDTELEDARQRFVTDHTNVDKAVFNARWQLSQRSGPWITVLVTRETFAGAGWGSEFTSYVANVDTLGASTSARLVAPDKFQQLVEITAAAITKLQGREPLREEGTWPAAIGTQLARSLVPDVDGDLLVQVAPGVLTAYSDGAFIVEIPQQEATGLLTADGAAWLAVGIAAQEPAALPEEPEAPEPEPTPSASPTTDLSAVEPDPVAPAAAQPAPGAEVDCAAVACVALTFDDGPGRHTDRLLDTLRDAQVPATFFILGSAIAGKEATLQRMVQEGHALGNHTWDHPDLTGLSPAQVEEQLRLTNDAILAAAGVAPTSLRPPYGAFVPGQTPSGQLPVVLWDVDTEDWKNRNVAETTKRAVTGVKPGSIILLHDIHPTSVDAVPGIIHKLQEAGYVFVTVPTLLGQMEPGAVYYSR
ncbi:hypothetical protein EII12_04065 [Buchananella hordeovulneris]|uniref:polysaccharide deacetylase family protein n=1 Tax=Buchananella hordeovulneris TaxID=52770 RepID=UPI000F5DD1DA|nr:polysaccharide deacetylase family protein [Buchananella hordeovulneris]RRD52757.1 hypothetical protein EII12_04065 [Buchananella hordeovulneris]